MNTHMLSKDVNDMCTGFELMVVISIRISIVEK